MAGTYLIYALWLGEDYAGRYFIPALLYLALFWLMFHAVHTLRVIRNVTLYAKFRVALASLHGAVFYILLVALLDFGGTGTSATLVDISGDFQPASATLRRLPPGAPRPSTGHSFTPR